MNNKYMSRRLINGFLVISSVTSLALLGLQFLTSALGSPASTAADMHMDSRLAGGGFYWWTTIVQACLVLTLVLTALLSLFSLRLSKRLAEADDACPGVLPVHEAGNLDPLREENLLTRKEEIRNGRFQFQTIAQTVHGANSQQKT
ncbi:MAG: hypothetical protein ACLQAH_00970 [Limisphaerales bacterium]